MTEIYISQAAIARALGVTRAAVRNWINRFPADVPDPAAHVDDRVPLWRPEQITEWREFQRRRDMAYDELIRTIKEKL